MSPIQNFTCTMHIVPFLTWSTYEVARVAYGTVWVVCFRYLVICLLSFSWQVLRTADPGVCCKDWPGIPHGNACNVLVQWCIWRTEDLRVPQGLCGRWPVLDGGHSSVSDSHSPTFLWQARLLTNQGDVERSIVGKRQLNPALWRFNFSFV